MSEKKSKKNTQIALVVAAVVAAVFFFVPVMDGQTLWSKVTAGWTNTPKPAGKERYPRPASTPIKYTSEGGDALEGSGPRQGTNAAPVHDISAREQSDLDRLIEQKMKK